jgi:tRNA A-37 threonylcarbamoyl transferase component Bud32
VQKIVFADSWDSYFQRFGLTTLEDFYRLGATYKPRQMATKKSVVVNFQLGEEEEQKEFFLKWHLRVPFKNNLSAWRKFGRRHSQTRAEWETAHMMTQAGFPTYQPVCYGEEMGRLFEIRSFLVTQKLTQMSLLDFVKQNWTGLSEPEREKLFLSLAAFIRRLHDRKIRFPDLYTKHIFLQTDSSGNYTFTLIDLARVSQTGIRIPQRAKDLGALDQSLPHKIVGCDYRKLFVRAYADSNEAGDVENLYRAIRKRSQQLDQRGRPSPDD